MTHPFLTRGGAELTGGPARVTLPTEPVQPAPSAPLPGSTAPTPMMAAAEADGEGAGSMDAFEFEESVLGEPNSVEEAYELLGYVPTPSFVFPITTLFPSVFFRTEFGPDGTAHHHRVQPHEILDDLG